MTTKLSNASAISTVKSAPSGLDQIQPTVSTPQQPTLLMKSFSGSVVQVPPSTTIQKSSAAWTPGQRPAQAPAPGLSGHAGSEKGNRVHMPSTATVFSQQFPQLDRGSQTGFTKTSSTGVKTATTMTALPVTVTPAQQSGGTEMEAFILELEKVSIISICLAHLIWEVVVEILAVIYLQAGQIIKPLLSSWMDDLRSSTSYSLQISV